MPAGFQVKGQNPFALFSFKIHRGDGMCLLAMNWKNGKSPANFVGFSIEYQQPGDPKFYPLKNRLRFPNANPSDPNRFSTLQSPISKFRSIHFPRNADLAGDFSYWVKPCFMIEKTRLTHGHPTVHNRFVWLSQP